MHTHILMSASAIFMVVLGLSGSFLSHEFLAYIGAAVETQSVVLVQALGAVYLGFGVLNWYTRNFVIGGIYNRPLGFGNTIHFLLVAIALIKLALALRSPGVWVLAAIYSVFAAWFALVLYSGAPKANRETDG